MSQSLKISLAAAIGLSIASSLTTPSRLLGEEPALGPRHGVLLLRNGELVEGDVLLSGDRYDVGVAGGQIHIKRTEVEYVGQSTLDCYEQRKSHAEPGKVQENLELATWCLRQNLYEQAALALAEAVDADPLHPRIALLERQLKFALEQPAETPTKAARTDDAPSVRDLDRIAEGLPDGCVEAFTTSIQPMIMNHCSTAGCHGPQSPTPLKLLRISAGRAPSRRATQRNLYSVLSLVDRQHPDESPLLTIPTRPHGNVKSAIFSTRETNQYRQLVAWAYQVANQPLPEAIGAAAELPGPTARRVARRQQPHKIPRIANDSSPDGTETKAPAARKPPGQPATHAKGSDTAEVDAADEVDLFDPAVFNQRYHPADEPE
jgi:hypothetical protein